jgi:anti-anti-sigma factor
MLTHSIRNKLLAVLGLNLILMLVLSGVALFQMRQMHEEANTLATDAVPSLDLIGRLTFLIAEYHALQTEHMVTPRAEHAELEAEMQIREGEIDTTFAQFTAFDDTAAEAAALTDLQKNWASMVQRTHQVLLPASRANNQSAAFAAFHDLDVTYDAMLATDQQLVLTQAHDATAVGEAASVVYDTARVLAVVITIAALLSSAVIGVIVTGRLTRNLTQLTAASQAVATGNLAQSVVVHGQDEMATLAATFNQMTRALVERTTELEHTLADLQASVATRDQLSITVRMLASPVIPVMEGILVMPLIGAIDSARAAHMMETILHAVDQQHAQVVLLDVTGVPLVDTYVAQALLHIMRAVQLLGAKTMLVGLRPELAQTIVGLGLNLSALVTYANLQEGIRAAMQNPTYTGLGQV